MALKISLQEAIRRVREARTLADIESLFRDAFGLTEAQIKGARGIPGLPDAEAPIELTQAAKMANPNYGKGDGYARNCQRCVVVYELLRRGYKVHAKPNPYKNRSGTTKRPTMNGSECFVGAIFHGYGRDSSIPLDKAHLLRSLNMLPDGMRSSIYWVATDARKAHVIICEKINGNLFFLDPQTGKRGNHVLGNANKATGYFWYRIDNLPLNEQFEWDEVVEYDRG